MVTLKQRIEELVQLDLEDRMLIVEALSATFPPDDDLMGFTIDDELFAELEQRRMEHERDPSTGMTAAQMWKRVDEKSSKGQVN